MVEPIFGFDWDAANREKCKRHGVRLEEIETALRGPMRIFPDPEHSATETRYLGFGRTSAGRHVLVAFTYRTKAGHRFIRPISARFMHAKEIKHYEAQTQDPRQTAATED